MKLAKHIENIVIGLPIMSGGEAFCLNPMAQELWEGTDKTISMAFL